MLLSAPGIDLNGTTNDPMTPLCRAAQRNNITIAQILLSTGADMNRTDRDGITPLHYAAMHGHLDAVKALLAADANRKLRTKEGVTFNYTLMANCSLVCSSKTAKSTDTLLSTLKPLDCAVKICRQLEHSSIGQVQIFRLIKINSMRIERS